MNSCNINNIRVEIACDSPTINVTFNKCVSILLCNIADRRLFDRILVNPLTLSPGTSPGLRWGFIHIDPRPRDEGPGEGKERQGRDGTRMQDVGTDRSEARMGMRVESVRSEGGNGED